MWQILETIENSGIATWIRETPTWTGYSTVLAFHTFGMAFLVGLTAMIALRVLGFASGLPLAPLEKFMPLIVTGFWVNAVTGVILFSLAGTSFAVNPDFYVKLFFIACAIVSLRLLRASVFGGQERLDTRSLPVKCKVYAGAMLISWTLAIVAGRLTAYAFFIEWRTAVAVFIAAGIMLVVRYLVARYMVARFIAVPLPASKKPVTL